PAVAVAEKLPFGVGLRPMLEQFLDVAAGSRRRVKKDDAAGAAADVFPGVRDAPRHERAGAGAARCHRIADLERELAGDNPGDLVAVMVQVVETLRARR